MINKEALISYLDNGTVPEGPVTVHIDVSNACNLNCITCWNHSPHLSGKKTTQWKQQRLPLVAFTGIIHDLKALKVKNLIISGGGEPFTNESIYRMIALAKELGFKVTIITNALLIDTRRLLEAAPDKLLVNLCAASPATYVRVHPRRKPADFDALISKLKLINRQIPLTLVMVISNVNYFEIKEMAQLAAEFTKARLSFKLASMTPDTEQYGLTGKQKQDLIEQTIPLSLEICREQKTGNNLDVFESQLTGKKSAYPIEDIGCVAGLFYSRIFTDGEVFFCCAHIKVGNVFQMPFSRIWTSPAYNRIRKQLDKKNFYPACKQCGKFNLNFKARKLLDGLGY
ncbi:MAG: radical SAM protein [bacterium]|nr:radical SAM protein [bacterium]